MKDQASLLGIDLGTGGCKLCAISLEGELLAEAGTEYPTEHANPGWAEQNPQHWLEALQKALRKLEKQGLTLSQIQAIALDGSTHNAVLLDQNWQPLRKTIMWTDQRSHQECGFLQENYGKRIFATTYQRATPTWTLPQLLWLKKHEPEILTATRHLLFVKDYVRFLLTGLPASDHIEAQGSLFYDMGSRTWSEELFALTGLPLSVLPELLEPCDQAGQISAEASRLTGLAPGTPVFCGSSDSAVEDYAAGAVEPGDCVIKLATAGNVNIMSAKPCPSANTLTYSHIIPGLWYSVAATNAAALCQRWFRDNFCEREKLAAQQKALSAYQLMERLAQASPPGAGGVFFHPYLQGERSPYWDHRLRASFCGVSIASGKADFMRALLEGVAYSLRDCQGCLEKLGLPAKRIFLIGGGARSPLWSQIIADVFDTEVQVPRPGDASFGSALLAGVGRGVFADTREAIGQCLRLERSIKPNQENAAFYQKQFDCYKKIQAALAKIYQTS
ncbi:MAG: xylulokinase [Lentisphaeria bacterium]|nr:xylulokinase [Lentisphaeria bacterium]MDY0176422.1 xylulokinase [Lentisphaeria bacterium]NLZ59468.1 xylulokinase [Lentisphaerota bacterium]